MKYFSIEDLNNALKFEQQFQLIDIAYVDFVFENSVQISVENDINLEDLETQTWLIDLLKSELINSGELQAIIKLKETNQLSKFFPTNDAEAKIISVYNVSK
jgi:hypothetical protein